MFDYIRQWRGTENPTYGDLKAGASVKDRLAPEDRRLYEEIYKGDVNRLQRFSNENASQPEHLNQYVRQNMQVSNGIFGGAQQIC